MMALETAETDDDRLQRVAAAQPPFAAFMGMRLLSATRELVVGEMIVREDHGNRNGVLHGGAIMALADNLGGTTAFINLPEGAGTTTVESKTNFFRTVAVGETARAECTPLHVGRTTIVVQTRILRPDGKLAALVTQTQLVMQKR